MLKKPIVIFLGTSLVLAIIFFMFPIELFDAIVVMEEPMRSYEFPTRISLSMFLGIGYSTEEMMYVKDFYLTGKGMAMAFIFILGMPALLAYRVYLKSSK